MSIFILKTLFASICIIESSGNPNAVNGKAVGIIQIQPNVIADVNKWGYHYTLNDRLNPYKSEEIFYLYTNHYITKLKIDDSIQNRANIWRYGASGRKGRTPYALKAQSLVDKALKATF
jgi:hypothetical protein